MNHVPRIRTIHQIAYCELPLQPDRRKSKVSQLNMPGSVYQHVFRFDVFVDDAVFVEVAERQCYFYHVEHGVIFL